MKIRPTTQDRAAARAPRRRGFTLVEMLVVLGIIGIITASLLGSFGYLKTSAWQSRAQNQCHLVATALELYLQGKRAWPAELLGKSEFDADACAVLQRERIIDITTWKTLPTTTEAGAINSESPDRYGLLDPWGRAQMRRNPKSTEAQVKAHRLQFRLDENFDGYVDSSENSPQGARIRGAVIVWTRGPDGKDDFNSNNPKAKGRYPYDDRLSWSHGAARADRSN